MSKFQVGDRVVRRVPFYDEEPPLLPGVVVAVDTADAPVEVEWVPGKALRCYEEKDLVPLVSDVLAKRARGR